MNYLSPSVEDDFEKNSDVRNKIVIAEYVYNGDTIPLKGIEFNSLKECFHSIKECAKSLNISTETVTKYCNSGEWCEKCGAYLSFYNE